MSKLITYEKVKDWWIKLPGHIKQTLLTKYNLERKIFKLRNKDIEKIYTEEHNLNTK